MDTPYSNNTKQQVLERVKQTIFNLSQQLEDEKEFHRQLSYEDLLVSQLAREAETIAELDEWELEQCALDSLQAISLQEIQMIEEDLDKNQKLAGVINNDIGRSA